MNRIEAKWLLLRELVGWKHHSYVELRSSIGHSVNFERVTRTGTTYQLDVQVVWDDKPNGDIRIIGSIDDGGIRAFCPVTYGVLIAEPSSSAK